MKKYNERYSERKILDILGVKEGDNSNGIFVYAQEFPTKFKKVSSKNGGEGNGRPEFFITQEKYDNAYIVIENKRHVKKSKEAANDVVHYMKEMRKIDNKSKIFGIAFSGYESTKYELFSIGINNHITRLSDKNLSLKEINNEFFSTETFNDLNDNISKKLLELNIAFHGASLGASTRSKFLAAIIGGSTIENFYTKINLENNTKDLLNVLSTSINKFFTNRKIPDERIKDFMTQINASLQSAKAVSIQKIKEIINIWGETQINIDFATNSQKGIDILGKVFNEFLRYGAQDKKVKGQVLTPDHFAELFVHLANLKWNDKVLDITCGTGAFLVHSLMDMLSKANAEKDREQIRKNAVWGNDNDANMTLLSILNLVLHGDGISNIRYGDALYDKASGANDDFQEWINLKNPNGISYALINPPYYKPPGIPPEPVFIKRAADLIKIGGLVIAIHPVSVLLGNKYKDERYELMSKHTLKATMIAPKNLFTSGSETAISIWEAHKHHEESDFVWFADWTDDGFETVKNKHRQNVKGKWQSIMDKWVSDFNKKSEIDGYSVYVNNINADSEWTLFPYVKTNYKNLKMDNFIETIDEYIKFIIDNEGADE